MGFGTGRVREKVRGQNLKKTALKSNSGQLTKNQMSQRPASRGGIAQLCPDGSDSLVGRRVVQHEERSESDARSMNSLSEISGASERERELEDLYKEARRQADRYREKLAEMERNLARTEREARLAALTLANKPVQLSHDQFRRVVDYGKKEVFRYHKFFTRESDVSDYTIKGSAGDMTMQHFNVEDERKMQWWHAYKPAVEDGINYSRHAGQTQIGRKLSGTYRHMGMVHVTCI